MSWLKRKELAEKRDSLLNEANDILNRTTLVGKEMNAEEKNQFDCLHRDAENLYGQIGLIEKQKVAEERLGRNPITSPESDTDLALRGQEKWMRYGKEACSPEEWRAFTNCVPQELRAVSGLSTTTANAGAEFVATQTAQTFVEKIKAYGGVRENATVINVASGSDFKVPTLDDTGKAAEKNASEVRDDADYDPDTDNVTITTNTYDSGVVRVPVQFLQDTLFPVESWLPERLAIRLNRKSNYDYTVDATSGLTNRAGLGKTAASTVVVSYTELLDLKHSVDPIYRTRAKYMFNDSTLLSIKKLVDGNGNMLWNRGDVANGIPQTIDGDQFVINQDMPDIGTASRCVLYGDFSYYWIIDCLGIQLTRFAESYMKYLQVGFMAWMRSGGNLTNTDAVKYIVCPTSSGS